ncbi:MAG: FGGY family carbohydrate kinase [Oscillibacter sp.]|nr:FGGY family carbohydrate kinase [Oscillibacter sp.]MEA4994195.1 FGGY family carbohydrate kinase [Oscillibacter sp.]
MLAGIDVGSTGLKVSLFLETGERLHYAYREYSLEYQGEDQVVIDPALWWDSLCSCIQELSACCDLRQLRGLGISHANAMVLSDSEARPLFKAIMQLDKRGQSMTAVIADEFGNDDVFSITGNNNAAGFVWGPTLKWLSIFEPEKYRQIRYLFNPSSYLVMRLSGIYCMDHTRAATTMLYDIHQGQWSSRLCQFFGLSEECLPPLHRSSDVVGYTTGAGGLPSGIPVVAGAMDTMAAVVGLGSGQTENALIMGSVGRFVLASSQLDRRFLNTVLPDRSSFISMTPVNHGGIAVRWARNLLFSNRSPGESCYDRLDELAAAKAPGAGGLMFFPYLTGASCPRWDNGIRGAYLNVKAFHDTGDFARATMEGVGYTLAEGLNILQNEVGIRAGRIYCGGGGARSRVWTQILSDIFGVELIIPEYLETETIGCAILAGIGAGILSPQDLISWNHAVRVVRPNQDNHQFYQSLLEKFTRSHQLLQEAQEIFSN